MDKNVINYQKLLNEAMHSVIRETLKYVKNDTPPGNHFFYISFLTNFKNVKISDTLKKQYPEQMTIILQYQFKNLIVEEDSFSVTLCFNNKEETLYIPYESILRFADPSVNIELHFVPTHNKDANQDNLENATDGEIKPIMENLSNSQQTNNIINLDKLRKK